MLLHRLPLHDPPRRHQRRIPTRHPRRVRRELAQAQRPVLLVQPREAGPAARVRRRPEARPRTQVAEADDGAGARVGLVVFEVGGRVHGFEGEEADAGEEGPQRGEAGADYAEGLLDYRPDHGGRDGVFEVLKVG